MLWLDILLAIVLGVACVGGMLLAVLQLPGTWLILAAAVGFGWYHGWQVIGLRTVVILAVIAVVAEVVEQLCGVWFAGKGGASRRAAWWGLFGGMAGALLLTVPVPVIGTIIGAAIGCFCGAMAAELSLEQSAAHGVRVGAYSAVGRTVGTMLKISAAVMMAGVTAVSTLL